MAISSITNQTRAFVVLLQELQRRLVRPILMVVTVFVVGSLGYWIIGGGRWTLLDAMYMTSITLTTVGYGETLQDMTDSDRVYTMVLMWAGMATTLFAISEVTAFVVDRQLAKLLRERRMQKIISQLDQHYIVCGVGTTGVHIVRELYSTKRDFVVIDIDPERVELIREEFPNLPIVEGDASDEDVLRAAGIEKARSLVANTSNDSLNLLITVQARYVSNEISIVSRAEDTSLNPKIMRAGADYVVNPSMIGGMRMASQMIRPNTVTFLDRMLRGQDATIRVDEARVEAGCSLIGKKLFESSIYETTGLRAIALQQPGEDAYSYNPSGQTEIQEGTIVIVVGNPEQLRNLRSLCKGSNHTIF